MISKKILLLAYAISPTRGSEYSSAWNYINSMSKDNELVVLYGASGSHMGDVDEMEHFNKLTPLSNVRFIPIKPNRFSNGLNWLNKANLLGYSFYLAYNIWHRQVYKKAKKLIENENFDLIHFLGPTGYREPGYLNKINLPYIWGPIGGIQNTPKKLIKALPLKNKLFFLIKNSINTIQFRFNSRLKRNLQTADVILTATSENQKLIEDYYKTPSIYFPENGIVNSSIHAPTHLDNLQPNSIINILWIGSIDTRKSLNILLEALAVINSTQWNLSVIGDGNKKNEMQKLSKHLGVDAQISWKGKIARQEVLNLLSKSHIHVVTSLGEGTPTTLWEAMSNGIPTISLDHCGMHDVICEKCGIKIPIQSHNQVVKDIGFQLNRLIKNPQEIKRLSDGVLKCAENYSWNNRHDFFNTIYELAIENWNKKQNRND